ncbi:MAG: M20/M25/M40 family metallo-hydrolase [Deltaproteobacteria bacterium]|nr:M20/M25/M40 family metallo-hydrolase [Deltaproteobacteria bacterium]
MSRLLSLVRRIIAINSTATVGTLSLARFMGGELRRIGFSVHLDKHRIKGAGQANLIARVGPRRGKALLINTHLDTVVTDPKRWRKTGGNPFRAVLCNGYIYGLGTADTKAALACQIRALHSLDLKKLKRPLILTGTFAEETGMAGVRELIKSRRLPRIRYALNSEPTGLQPVIGNYGFRVYRIEIEWKEKKGEGKIREKTFKGRAAHSAKPWLGKNAIVDCLKWLERRDDKVTVVEMKGGLEANIVAPFCRIKFIPSKGPMGFFSDILKFLDLSGKKGQTHNLGTIEFKQNRLTVTIDHRFGPGIDPRPREKELRKCFSSAGRSATCVIHLERDNPAFSQSPKSKLVGKVRLVLRSMGKKPYPAKRPGCTEAGYLAQIADELITIGPGVSYGNAHQPNERVRVKELEEAVAFYRRIIEKSCF